MQPVSEADVKSMATNLPRSAAKRFRLPPNFHAIDFASIEFLAWTDRSEKYVFVVEDLTGPATVHAFEAGGKTSSKPQMCDVCCSVHRDVRLLTSRDAKKHTSRGFWACSGLACVDKVRTIGVDSMRETISLARKIERMKENLVGKLAALESE